MSSVGLADGGRGLVLVLVPWLWTSTTAAHTIVFYDVVFDDSMKGHRLSP